VGSACGGQSLLVDGTGFVPGSTTVAYGDQVVGTPLVSVLSPTRLRLLLPAASTGQRPVTVTTRGGTSKARSVEAETATPRAASVPTFTGPNQSVDLAPVLSGRGRPGATVTVVVDGLDWCTTTVASDRTWTCVGSRPLLRGSHQVAARQVRDGWSTSPLSAWTRLTTGPA
jgi:hypothetical protein